MNEIIIKTDLQLGSVIDNFDDVKAQVAIEMEQFKGITFGPDQIKKAKETRANLNKIRTIADDRRKAIKKQFLEPLVVFEGRVKEIMALIDAPIAEIDAQLVEFEAKRVTEKKAAIQEILDELLAKRTEDDPTMEAFYRQCSLSWTYDSKWENSSVSLTAISQQINDKITNVIGAKHALDDGSKYGPQLLGQFQESGDLLKVLEFRKKLEEQDRIYEERRLKEEAVNREREEAARKAREEAENARQAALAAQAMAEVVQDEEPAQEASDEPQGEWVAEPEPAPPVAEITAPAPVQQAPVDKYAGRAFTETFRVIDVSFQQLSNLIAYMAQNGIAYERVRKNKEN